MNNITKILSIILLSLLQANVFAYEVGDTISGNGVNYYVVEKHFIGRYFNLVKDNEFEDHKSFTYLGQVLAIGADKTTKNICIAKQLFVVDSLPSDSVVSVEQYHVMGINDDAFANEDLESITMPEFVERIGSGAFRNTKVARGTLWMPKVSIYGEGVFTNLRADVCFKTPIREVGNQKIATKLNHTFEPVDSLPKIIVESSVIRDFSRTDGWPTDKMLCYGCRLLSEKRAQENEGLSTCDKIIIRNPYKNPLTDHYLYTQTSFSTAPRGVVIGVQKKTFKKKEKNPYTIYNDTRDYYCTPYFYYYGGIASPTFKMNNMLFRLENGDQYTYFTLDGKQLEYDVVANKDGLDPFGARIISEEEIEKRKAKEVNIKKLDKKADDLMKRFGF